MARTHECMRMHTHAVSSHVLPALLVIPQTNYNVFPPPPFSSSTSLTLLSPSSCNWIWIKMAFPFLLYSSLLWLKRDLPGEITHKHRCTLTDCSAETLHLRKNIFTNKQAPTLTHHPSLPPACTIATSSIARGQQPLLPSLSFTALLLSHTLGFLRLLNFLHPSPLSSLHSPPPAPSVLPSFTHSSSPPPSSHFCSQCSCSGQRSRPHHSVMLTPSPPTEYCFLREQGPTSCHSTVSS